MSVSRTVFGLYISILSVGFFVVFLIPLLIFLFLMIYYPYGTNLLQLVLIMSPMSLPYFALSCEKLCNTNR